MAKFICCPDTITSQSRIVFLFVEFENPRTCETAILDSQVTDTCGSNELSVRLPERIGRAKAKELMFTSRRLRGPAAFAIGLVDHCVADDMLDATVASLAAEILQNSPGTNRIDKALLAAGAQRKREEALRFERAMPFGLPDDMMERMSKPKR